MQDRFVVMDPDFAAANGCTTEVPLEFEMLGVRFLRGVPVIVEAEKLRPILLLKSKGLRLAADSETTLEALERAARDWLGLCHRRRIARRNAEWAAGVTMKVLRQGVVNGRFCSYGERIEVRGARLVGDLIGQRRAVVVR